MKKHHRLQLALFFVYILIATALMLRLGVGITPDRYLIVLLAGAFLIKHSKHFIHDFAPFILIIIGYDFIRGFASSINHQIDFKLPIEASKLLLHGHILTVDLQQLLYTSGKLNWYDYATSYLYLLHFAVPLLLAFFLWFQNRRQFREFMLALSILSYTAVLVYLLHPTAPPWLASKYGYIPHITKIFNVVIHNRNLPIPTLYGLMTPNLVAAVPSMHVAYSFLVFLFTFKYFKPWGILALSYTVAMWFTVIYLGEHYMLDVLSGAIFAFIAYKLSELIMDKYHKQLEVL